MQTKTDSKIKINIASTNRQYQSMKQTTKIATKITAPKSKNKKTSNKNKNHSLSKSKQLVKPTKNNENYNSVNMHYNENVKQGKSQHLKSQDLKKEVKKQGGAKHNSGKKMMKAKSMVKLQPKTDRIRLSPSSISTKELNIAHEDKSKTSRFPVNRVYRDKKNNNFSKQQPVKLKKSKSKLNVLSKKEGQMIDRGNANRQSIKTQMSSKMHSVTKEDNRCKRDIACKVKSKINKKDNPNGKIVSVKMSKQTKKSKIQSGIQRSILYSQVSFQQYNHKQNPYESALEHSQKYFLPYPNAKSVKTQGCLINSKSQHKISGGCQDHINAAIKIQSYFRGFITRKYINQAKYIVGKVKIIQNWWRKVLKKLVKKVTIKAASVQNSLITIKDFNQTFKTDKHKFSQSKQNTFSNNKVNIKELIRNIMQEEDEQSNSSNDANQSRVLYQNKDISLQKSSSKQAYIELKIKDQIKSEKIFNSPKQTNSPCPIVKTPTNTSLNIKQFFNSNSNETNKIRELMHSPRMTSPMPPKNTPNNNPPIPPPSNNQQVCMFNQIAASQTIRPFQTKFSSIEEICLLLVNFFRDRHEQMNNFIMSIEQLKYFRSRMVLRSWNTYNLSEQSQAYFDETASPDYQFMQSYMKPLIFTQSLRNDILAFPQIQIDLNDKKFALSSKLNGPIHHCFLDFIFDAMEQAFYQPFKSCILSYGQALNKHVFKDSQSIFQYIFSTALGYMFDWGSIMCGLMMDLPPQQQGVRELRMRQFQKRQQNWDLGLIKMGLKMQVAQVLFMDLIEQWYWQTFQQQQ